ncbi:HET-domain-containing protein [Paxillus ammoniavirescens]|nr:HET-domain-containing protein [Paxillus ammoniavirescens]
MRLLNVHTLELENFPGVPPPYATISHRWGEAKDEVSFQDILQHQTPQSVKNKPGFAKILGCSEQTKKHGLNYIWIDTCCIDKTDNTELQEAINSMWDWYQDCDRCFVYMNDVRSGQNPDADDSDFSRSQWFRRGWTLQELLAPAKITFFAEDWSRIGKKAHRRIMKRIGLITGIPEGVLSDGDTTSFSIARKMSWASQRTTTKKEDRAYSLMGVFEITMPIIYGGGENMFVKFQREIMKRSVDQSIFAWAVESASPTATTGLLTSSPAYFNEVDKIPYNVFVDKFSDLIKPDPTPPQTHYSHTNLGIHITLPMKRVKGKDSLYLAMLRCTLPDNPDRPLCIYLQPLAGGNNQWVRTRIGELIPVPRDGELFENTQIFAKEDTSFFDPRKRKRAASNDTSITSIRGSFARSSSANPPLKRQAAQESLVPSLPPPIPLSVEGTRPPPTTPTGPRSNVPRSRDGPSELPLPVLVKGGAHAPTNVPPPTPTKIPPPRPTNRHDRRINPPPSRDTSNDHLSPISAGLPPSAPEMRRGPSQESRSWTLRPFVEGPVSKIWYNESYTRGHPKRSQFWDREHKPSRSLSPQHSLSPDLAWPHSPPGEQERLNQYAVQTSRPRSNSLTTPGEPSLAEPSMPSSHQRSTPVGSYGVHRRHLQSPPRASDTPPADLGEPVGLVRGRNPSQKPLGSPESSRSRSLHPKPATITINVTPADGVPFSCDPLLISSVPTTPSSAPRSERTISSASSSAPVTPPQIPLPLTTRSMSISEAKASFHGQEESDPFESSLNPAALLRPRLHTQPPLLVSPVPDVARAIPTNGGGYIWIGAPSVQTETPSHSASSQRSKSGASFMRRLKGLFRRKPSIKV